MRYELLVLGLVVLVGICIVSAAHDGPVAYYSFDDGTADDQINNNNGVLMGGASIVDGGKINKAVSFEGFDGYEGSADYIEVNREPLIDNLRTSSWTISGWMKRDEVGVRHTLVFLGDTRSALQDRGFGIKIENNNLVSVFYRSSKGGSDVGLSGGISVDTDWHHITVVRDKAGDELLIYVDGVFDSKSSGIPDIVAFTEDRNLGIGVAELNSGSEHSYMDGLIDEIYIFNRALTSEEVGDLYINGYNVPACDDGIDNDEDGLIDALVEITTSSQRIDNKVINTGGWIGYNNNGSWNHVQSCGVPWVPTFIQDPVFIADVNEGNLVTVEDITGNYSYLVNLPGWGGSCDEGSDDPSYPPPYIGFYDSSNNLIIKKTIVELKNGFEVPEGVDSLYGFFEDEECYSYSSNRGNCTFDVVVGREPACNNGLDDDGDSLVDMADDGCFSLNDDSEKPHDPGCSSVSDDDETDPVPPSPCSDDQTIMKLSDEENALGGLWNSNHNHKVCYSEIFSGSYIPSDNNFHDCSPDSVNPNNFVLWLSQSEDSLASTTKQEGFDIPVCYGILKCQVVGEASITEGMIGYYNFNDDVMDSSVKLNHGVNSGATFVDGKYGKALSLDDVNDYVDINSEDYNFQEEDFSICAWVNVGGSASGNLRFLSRGLYQDSGWEWYISSNRNRFRTYQSGANQQSDGFIPSTDTWDFLCMVKEDQGVRFYKNDETPSSPVTHIDPTSYTGDLMIGKYADDPDTYDFEGMIDELKIFNRALSDEEIQKLYALIPGSYDITCPQGKELVIRLSQETGSYMSFAEDTNNPMGICCESSTIIPPLLTRVYWADRFGEEFSVTVGSDAHEVGLGTVVRAVVEGSELQDMEYEIWEVDGGFWFIDERVAQTTTKGYLEWRAGTNEIEGTLVGGSKYYFKARPVGDSAWLSTEDNDPGLKYIQVSDVPDPDAPSVEILNLEDKQIYFLDEKLNFTAKISNPANDFNYTWDLGNGETRTGNSVNLENYEFDYAYTGEGGKGQKNIVLTAEGQLGTTNRTQISILIVNSAYILAYIDSPKQGQTYGMKVDFDANSSYVVDSEDPLGDCNFVATCLAGKCPGKTGGCPPCSDGVKPGCQIDVIGGDPEVQPYDGAYFNWTIDPGVLNDVKEGYGLYHLEDYRFPVVGLHRAILKVSYNPESVLETNFNVLFPEPRCYEVASGDNLEQLKRDKIFIPGARAGRTYWVSDDEKKESQTDCYRETGITKVSGEPHPKCCPQGYYCDNSTETLAANDGKGICKVNDIQYCREYADETNCTENSGNQIIASAQLDSLIDAQFPGGCSNYQGQGYWEPYGDKCFEYLNCFCKWNSTGGNCYAGTSHEAKLMDLPNTVWDLSGGVPPTGMEVCDPGSDPDPVIGQCNFEFTYTGDCSEGYDYIRRSWSASWDPPEAEQMPDYCKPGSDTISCENVVRLGFFNWVNVVIVVFILIVIYYYIIRRGSGGKGGGMVGGSERGF